MQNIPTDPFKHVLEIVKTHKNDEKNRILE